MRVIPKRASVCGLHTDAVAAHPSLYQGMHFAAAAGKAKSRTMTVSPTITAGGILMK